MADEREGAAGPKTDPASETRIQKGGREANAAQPLNAAQDRGGAERYPDVDLTDAVVTGGAPKAHVPDERRSFDPSADAPTPRGDPDAPAATGHLGPRGDPAEGRR